MWEVAWREINRRFEIVARRRAFRTEAARARFCEKLAEKDNFVGIIGFCD